MISNHFKTLALVGIFVLTTSTAYAITLSPNQNHESGHVPNGHADITFQVSDGNWTETLYLPSQPEHNDVVNFRSNATYKTYIESRYTDLPSRLVLQRGNKISFKYDSNQKKWKVQVKSQFPTNETQNTTVRVGNDPVTKFVVEDGRWTQNIILPRNSSTGQLVRVESRAQYDSKINASGSTFTIKTGQSGWFSYESGRWSKVK